MTSPPITTVASGRWTSAPAVVDKAIGTNPRLATRAVIDTGREPDFRASQGRLSGRKSFIPQLVEVAHQHDAVQHRNTEQGKKADSC